MPLNLIKSTYYKVTRSSPEHKLAQDIYDKIASQARNETFYTTFMIPDSIEGRFEMLTLHIFLYLQRLKVEDKNDEEIAKLVLETFFSDIDGALREMGTGDLAVPKKVKKLANSFYARVYAYSEALEADENGRFEKELQDNIYAYLLEVSDNTVEPEILQGLAEYVKKSYKEVCKTPIERFLNGDFQFITPELKS